MLRNAPYPLRERPRRPPDDLRVLGRFDQLAETMCHMCAGRRPYFPRAGLALSRIAERRGKHGLDGRTGRRSPVERNRATRGGVSVDLPTVRRSVDTGVRVGLLYERRAAHLRLLQLWRVRQSLLTSWMQLVVDRARHARSTTDEVVWDGGVECAY
jgi:hypothetical protein